MALLLKKGTREYLSDLSTCVSGSDVALGYTCNDVIQAKLCDFSHAVSLERELDEDDEEDIRQHLLPAIVPPEVLTPPPLLSIIIIMLYRYFQALPSSPYNINKINS